MSAKYQGYSFTVWPKIAHFHHNFNLQSKSINFNVGHLSVQTSKVIALLCSQKSLIFITCQSAIKSINFNSGHLSEQTTKFIALLFGHKSLIFITFQSAIKINQFQVWSCFGAKYQGYSLTFWPQIAHFHHFSICNQNQSMSILVICRSEISRLWPYFSATNRSFSSLVNLQSKSINLKFDHGSEQYSKVIAILCSHKSLIFITFQSAIKFNQFQFWSLVGAKYQGYSLTFWPKIAHFHHFSICNQNQSMSILVICRSEISRL